MSWGKGVMAAVWVVDVGFLHGDEMVGEGLCMKLKRG